MEENNQPTPPQADTSVDSSIEPTKTGFKDNQLSYPLDHDSRKIIEKLQLDLKYPREYMKNTGRILLIKFDDAVALATGDGQMILPIPVELDGTRVIAAHAAVSTVSSSGTVDVQIRNITDAVDMLTTKITIDANEFDSYTAAAPPVISFANSQLSKSDRIAVDIDSVGTGSKGLCVILTIQ